ncbi:NPCBM/NEW2 domain-containing protein [Bacillus sp. 31A1R]|uniref:NPCBM/NEW2 domain-containing protein n=1 Tax=Robertmurraya mangrovi TaxID=3098077 RepID=A0ABU5ITC5_9BACI|nr:NPCBM/NEW2 domain-containing protein [Bacillus sp. 31A1R]MDZ5470410.1 NPCBM/NEW2 domain-containing protein [Bacillus sp. 31A1R]
MKKQINSWFTICIIAMLLFYIPTASSASGDSVSDLKKQISTLKKELAKVKKENAEFKKVTKPFSGGIYIDGVKERSASFLTYKGKNYVSLEDVVPALRGGGENGYKFVSSKKQLYVGVFPVKGAIQLTNYPYYNYYGGVVYNNGGKGYTINGERYITGISGVNYIDPEGIIFKVKQKYKYLNFKVGAQDGSKPYKSQISIKADGNIIYNSGDLEIQEDAVDVSLDIADYDVLTIEFDGWDYSHPVMASPILIPK